MTYTDNTSAKMASALATVANGASVKAASEAHGVSVRALYAAMRRHGLSGGRERCPTCGRLKPGRAQP